MHGMLVNTIKIIDRMEKELGRKDVCRKALTFFSNSVGSGSCSLAIPTSIV